jgi:hypothetical protein
MTEKLPAATEAKKLHPDNPPNINDIPTTDCLAPSETTGYHQTIGYALGRLLSTQLPLFQNNRKETASNLQALLSEPLPALLLFSQILP